MPHTHTHTAASNITVFLSAMALNNRYTVVDTLFCINLSLTNVYFYLFVVGTFCGANLVPYALQLPSNR